MKLSQGWGGKGGFESIRSGRKPKKKKLYHALVEGGGLRASVLVASQRDNYTVVEGSLVSIHAQRSVDLLWISVRLSIFLLRPPGSMRGTG